MNLQRDYRISKVSAVAKSVTGSRNTLPPVASSLQQMPNKLLRPTQRFSEIMQHERKDALTETIIQEHMIKYGYVNAFDVFVREIQEREVHHQQVRHQPNKPPISLSEMQQSIMQVVLDQKVFQRGE